MDRRLLAGLAVLGVAIAVGLGIVVSGDGDDDSGGGTGTDTTTALSNDQRPAPGEDGGAGGGEGSGDGSSGEDGSSGDGTAPGEGTTGSGDDGGTGSTDGTGSPDGGGAGGGGGNEPIGDPAEVAAVTTTLTTYLQAIAAGDGDGACEQLSPSGVETMLAKIAEAAPETEGAPCPQAIVLYQGAYGNTAADPTFKRIRVSGTGATALGPLKEPARLSLIDGHWLIDEYGQ